MKENGKRLGVAAAVVMVVIAAVLLLSRGAGFGSVRSGLRIGYVGTERTGEWSGRYALLDGYMKHTMKTGRGGTWRITVETKEGSIGITLTGADGSLLFDESELKSGEFTVEGQGKITAEIRAEGHKGSFSIISED